MAVETNRPGQGMLDISLYLPRLLDTGLPDTGEPDAALPALELLLAKARQGRLDAQSCNTTLCQLFAYLPAAGEDAPMAAIGRLMDDDSRPEGYWLRADPVHLHADQRSLVLLAVEHISLTQHDALALAACVQQSFTELGWQLEVPVPGRWYVKAREKPRIRTTEIEEVVGRDIRPFMPTGEDAGLWHRLMNEIQMRLHSADINQLRQERGELPVNSLWFWGSGCLPPLLERRWTRVYSDDNNTMGLCMLSNTPCLPLPATANEVVGDDAGRSSVLVVCSEFQSASLQVGSCLQKLRQFEQEWCVGLLQRLRQGDLRSVRIITRSQEFYIDRLALLKFWKRVKNINLYSR